MLCAEALIDQRVAACVNILSPCASVYRWQGKVESTDEIPILIKTQRSHYDRVEQLIKMMHPYELPEVILVPIQNGLPAYLQWIAAETSATDYILLNTDAIISMFVTASLFDRYARVCAGNGVFQSAFEIAGTRY